MKRPVLVVLVVAMLFSLMACGQGSTNQETTTATATADSKDTSTVTATADSKDTSTAIADSDQKKLKIAYFALSMSNQWMQNVEKALKALGKEQNFEVITCDAAYKAETQLSQIDTVLAQGIDGAVLFVCDEAEAPAAIEKFKAANVPVIGETLKLQDANKINIAPYVELDAFNCGGKAGTWVAENYKNLGFDFSDLSKVGYISITKSVFQSNTNRVLGFEDKFFAAIPNFPKDNKFIADCASITNSKDEVESAFNLTSTILTAHPNIKTWVIFGSVDDYTLGACRAVENAGLDDSTILTSTGGERAVKEWENGAGKAWRATVYYDAMDDALLCIDGLMQMVRQGVKPEDLWPDQKESGQTISVSRFSGNVATAADYKQFLKSY